MNRVADLCYLRLREEEIVRISCSHPPAPELASLVARLDECRLGGVFIESLTPYAEGTLVSMELALGNHSGLIYTDGVVRFSGNLVDSRGMGILIFQVAGIDPKSWRRLTEKGEQVVIQERRRYIRIPMHQVTELRLKVGWSDIEQDNKQQTTVHLGNISPRGCYLLSPWAFPVGGTIEFDIHLSEEFPLHVVGVVRWTRRQETGFGLGVEFLQVSARHPERVAELIGACRDQMAGPRFARA